MLSEYQQLEDGQEEKPSPSNQTTLMTNGQNHVVPIPEEKPELPQRITYVISQQQMKRIRHIARLLATGTMVYDAASIFLSLDDMEEMGEDTITKIFDLSVNELFYFAPLFYAVPFFSINYNGIIDGIKISVAAYNTVEPIEFKSPFCGRIACNCCHCCSNTLIFAIIFMLGGFASFIEGVGGHFFVTEIKEIPAILAKIIGILCAIFVANTTLLTETPELFLAFCANEDSLPLVLEEGEEPPQPKNEEEPLQLGRRAKYASVLIGNTLRIFDGVVVSIEAYVYLVALNSEPQNVRYLLFGLGFLRSTTNFCFTGEKGVEAIDALFLKISHPCQNRDVRAYLRLLKEILVGLAAMFPTIIIMDLLRELYRQFLTDPATQLPFPSPQFLVEIIAWLKACLDGSVLCDSLYSNILLPATDWVLNRPTQFCANMYDICVGPTSHRLLALPAEQKIEDSIIEEKKTRSSSTVMIIELMDTTPRANQDEQDDNKTALLSSSQSSILGDEYFAFIDNQELEDTIDPQNPPIYSNNPNRLYQPNQPAPANQPPPSTTRCTIM